MNKVIFFLFCLLVSVAGNAQINIVSNGDFEFYSTCPTTFSQTSNCTGWRQYTGGTSDFIHTCGTGVVKAPLPYFGYQQPASGNGYLGGYSFTDVNNPTNYTEYIAGSIAPLTIGVTYEVSMSVSLANNSRYGNNGLGMWFYDNGPTSVVPFSTLTVTPQLSFAGSGIITDTINWVRLTAQFTADSAYDNLVIGMFIPPGGLQTKDIGGTSGYSYYYIDSVWIRVARGINNHYQDSLLCVGDQIQVPFTINAGTVINPGNVYTAQLSDITGSFVSGVTNIGTLTSSAGSGSISCVIPAVTPGDKYRIRIISSNTVDSSDESRYKIAIGETPKNFKANVDMPICEGDVLHVYATSTTQGVKYSWTGPVGFTSTSGDNKLQNAKNTMNGDYVVVGSVYACTATDKVNVVVKPYPENLKASTNTPICIKNTLELKASTTSPGSKFTWKGPCGYTSNDSVSLIKDCSTCYSGTFEVSADREGCIRKTTVDVKVIDAYLDLGPDEVLCNGQVVTLNSNGYSNATFLWQDGSTSAQYTVTKPGIYWATANTECGLLADTVRKDYELCECTPFVPSAFTPNNDGLNDKVGSYVDCKMAKYDMLIVNRFGEVMFRSNDPKQKWDGMYKGQYADVGTYFYQLNITGPRDKKFLFKGDITLVR